MRDAAALIRALTSMGVRLWEEEGDLRFSAPKGVLTPELKGEMARSKGALLALVREAHEATRPATRPIPRKTGGQAIPLSFAQQRLWFLDQLHPGNPAYNLPHAVRILGPLDTEAMRRAFRAVLERHEALRTVFVAVDGVPTQVVRDPGTVELALEDLTTGGQGEERESWVRQFLFREARRPFDLERGPLVRGHLWRLGPQEHVMAVVMHHAASDGWSEGVFAHELTTLYTTFSSSRPVPPLPPLPIQFGDYALWQRQNAEAATRKDRDYWRSVLTGAPSAMGLVTDWPRPSTQTFAGDRIPLTLPTPLSLGLVRLAAEEATTPFVVILAAWAALMGRHSRQDDLVVGVPVANRERTELEPLIGFLVNTLALRLDLSGEPTARALIRRVRRSMMEALEHQELPFEQVVEELRLTRDLSRPPLFQTMVAMVPGAPFEPPPGLTWLPLEVDFPFARLDLTLFVRGGGEDGFRGELEYNTGLFHPTTAARISGHLERILAAMAREPDRTVASMPLMDDDQRRRLLVEWNRTEARPGSRGCAHHLVEEQALATPGGVAVRSAAGSLTYAQLEEGAARVADTLAQLGVGPGVVVGICMQRTPELLLAILAIWKAGGAFLPLDPAHPQERLVFMAEDAGAALVMVDSAGERALPGARLRTMTLDRLPRGDAPLRPQPKRSPETPAYIMYTSGSSGRPKGVVIPHGGLVNYLHWCCEAYPAREGTGAPVYTSVGFDATLTSLLVPLVAGKTVHLLPEGEELETLAVELRSPSRYSFVKVTPAHLDVLEALAGDSVHPDCTGCIIIGGEALLGRHLSAWRRRLPHARFVNEYGPTETVVGCCAHALAPGDPTPPGRVPIGRPIANTKLFVLDEAGSPVPPGIPGELWVGGDGVGLGYVNRPDLTEERFASAGFREAEGGRLYRTGDLVRHVPDGALEYLGRMDTQINLNGFRIEPGEVEAGLREHPAIAECVVVAREGGVAGRTRLVAYFCRRPGGTATEKELIRWLRRRLPEFMVPSALVALDRLPLTVHGKVDRGALPAPNQAKATADYVPPSTPAEETLTEIWQEVLGVERVGIHDNFFDLGGDSILSIQVVARAARRGLVLSPRLLFQHQAIADLAALTQRPATPGPAARGPGGVVPLTPIQRWFFQRGLPAPDHYNQAVLLETSPGTDPTWLRSAFQAVVAHHEVFRHRFTRGDDGWEQTVAPMGHVADFQTLDLSHLPPSSLPGAVTQEVDRRQNSLDLAKGPLVRGLFMDRRGEPGRLAILAHHLVMDAVSWRILLDDMNHSYERISQGLEPDLPPATASFAEWAHGLVAFAAHEECIRDMEAWTAAVGSAGCAIPVDLPEDGSANTVASAETVTAGFTKEETRRLLEVAPGHFRASVNELLLTALARALAGWCEAGHILIDMEGHGREPQDDRLDVSRTVGWFTSLFPLRLPLDRHANAVTQVRGVAGAVRGIPSKGVTYGILRYLHPRGELLAPPDRRNPQVIWNYLGRWQAPDGEGPFLGVAAESAGRLADPHQNRSHMIEIEAAVVDDRLRVEWGYSTALHEASTMAGLAERFSNALRTLLTGDRPDSGETPRPLAALNEDQMERLSGILAQEDRGPDGVGT